MAVFRSKLSPSHRLNESCRSESVGAQNVFHKHANWSGKCIQGIVERHYAMGDQMGKESVQIFLGGFIAVIAVNPQDSDGSIPRAGYVCRVRSVRFHVI
jgi:hypothetical protein